MKKHPLLISETDAKRLSRAIPTTERLRNKTVPERSGGTITNTASVLVKTPGGGIPARSGTTLGKADCTIQNVDKSTSGVSDSKTLTVFNSSTTVVDGDAYVTAIRDRRGNYFADTAGGTGYPEECVADFFASGGSGLDSKNGVVSLRQTNAPQTFSIVANQLRVSATPGVFLVDVNFRFGIRTYELQIQNSNDYIFPASATNFTAMIPATGSSYIAHGVDAFRRSSESNGTFTSYSSAQFIGILSVNGTQTVVPTFSVSPNGGSFLTVVTQNLMGWTVNGSMKVTRVS